MGKNVYVGNMSYSTTQDKLQELFEAYGEVASVNVITDRETGRPRGFAFVEMADNASADAAIKGLNDTSMGGRNLKVNQAKPRGDRQSRAPRW